MKFSLFYKAEQANNEVDAWAYGNIIPDNLPWPKVNNVYVSVMDFLRSVLK